MTRPSSFFPAWLAVVAVAGGMAGWHLAKPEGLENAQAVPSAPPLVASSSAPLPICSGGKRHTCVVDGDTVWISGERIRLADIDAPELDGGCARERDLAVRSARRLAELLSRTYEIRRGDPADGRMQDRYGRTLAVIRVGGASVGTILVNEGLAQPWRGRKAQWC